MFGYVRPWKAELKFREFNRYRATYCGLCKAIGAQYGQLPRMAVTYDITFLVLLLQSLAEREVELVESRCALHPFRKRPIATEDSALAYGADLTILLTWYNLKDNLIDGEHVLVSRVSMRAMRKAFLKASARQPLAAERVMMRMDTLTKAEDEGDGSTATDEFGSLLGELVAIGFADHPFEDEYHQALKILGQQLGEWIYLLDALDDYESDHKHGRWNALSQFEGQIDEADHRLQELEESINRTAALLPYYNDAEIVGNIIQMGLPDTRRRVLAGEHATKI
ncbi:MAG: DUF5685 family protein [Fastidiosipilaceae bacterium]|jgi:hypothetical protein